jgi:hypothetical protein
MCICYRHSFPWTKNRLSVELIPWVGQTEELVYLGNHSVELTWAPSYPSYIADCGAQPFGACLRQRHIIE